MELVDVYKEDILAEYVLFSLLEERTPDQSISHKEVPSFAEHQRFIKSKPYPYWYLVKSDEGEWIGSAYITFSREVGLFLFEEDTGKGWGKKILDAVIEKHGKPLYANINPENSRSVKFFTGNGFRHIQNTYLLT